MKLITMLPDVPDGTAADQISAPMLNGDPVRLSCSTGAAETPPIVMEVTGVRPLALNPHPTATAITRLLAAEPKLFDVYVFESVGLVVSKVVSTAVRAKEKDDADFGPANISTPLALTGATTAKTIAPRAIKNVRSLRMAVSMTSGPERPDAAKGDR